MTDITKQARHYAPNAYLAPNHPITVLVAGCGGTGSCVLRELARINMALWSMDHPGFNLAAWDGDEITEANLGRQLYAPVDVGRNKAVVIIERINRFYGYRWLGVPKMWMPSKTDRTNIFISCVDKASTRVEFSKKKQHYSYWMDFGNSRYTGQAILGTGTTMNQPESEFKTVEKLSNIIEVHPGLKKPGIEDDEPSCSLAASLQKQDLFINPMVAMEGCHMLWMMFRQGFLEYHGVYVNLQTGQRSRLMIK